MTNLLTKAIFTIDNLNDYCVNWHFSLAGSVLNPNKMVNDIDIVVNHATQEKAGTIEAIIDALYALGYVPINKPQEGACNLNFYAHKPNEVNIPLHIIVYI